MTMINQDTKQTGIPSHSDLHMTRDQYSSLCAKLSACLTPEDCKTFLIQMHQAIRIPDQILTQGGTSNCWFVGRLGSLAKNDPNRLVDVILNLVSNGARSEHFAPEERKYLSVGFGERNLFSRSIQRMIVERLGVTEFGAVEDAIKASEELLLGNGNVIVTATDRAIAGGLNARSYLSSHNEQIRDLIIGANVILEWSPGNGNATTVRGQHAYHSVIIEKIADGRVYFREGVKSTSMCGPDSLRFHENTDGTILCSLPINTFANKSMAFYFDKDEAQSLGINELYYNDPNMKFSSFIPMVDELKAGKDKEAPLKNIELFRYVIRTEEPAEALVALGSTKSNRRN